MMARSRQPTVRGNLSEGLLCPSGGPPPGISGSISHPANTLIEENKLWCRERKTCTVTCGLDVFGHATFSDTINYFFCVTSTLRHK